MHNALSWSTFVSHTIFLVICAFQSCIRDRPDFHVLHELITLCNRRPRVNAVSGKNVLEAYYRRAFVIGWIFLFR